MWLFVSEGMYYMFDVLLLLQVVGPVEANPEYQVIVESNNLLVEIDNEICE